MVSDIVIVTNTWMRNDDEANIVLKTIRAYTLLGVPIIIADRESPKNYINEIKQLEHVSVFETIEGMTGQMLLAQEKGALHGKYILYTQSDKLDFAQHEAKRMLHMYANLDKKGILVPSRTKESFATYPMYQQKTEGFLNFFVSEYIGISQDYMAGPKIYPSSLVMYLKQLKGDIGWGIESFLYIVGKRLGMSFDFLPVFIQSPSDIDPTGETKQYRLQTVSWIIDGFFQGCKADLPQ